MNQFFGAQYSQEDLQHLVALRRSQNGASRNMSTSMVPPSSIGGNPIAIETTGIGVGDTLDEIIMQNDKEMQRRRNLQRDRRSSAMEMALSNSNLATFQFQPVSAGDINFRRQSTGQLGTAVYPNNSSPIDIHGPQIFTSPGHTDAMVMDTAAFTNLSAEESQAILNYEAMSMGGLVDTSVPVGIFPHTAFSDPFNAGMAQLPTAFAIPETREENLPPHRRSLQTNDDDDMMPGLPGLRVSDNLVPSPLSMHASQNTVAYTSASSPITHNMPIAAIQDPLYGISAPNPLTSVPQLARPAMSKLEPVFNDPYSKSGFDMLAALAKVTTRKDPAINIGKVDLSCAFVVCNVLLTDCPIIYVSDVFERMTGYTKHEILGRNCRFLQSPYGNVEGGTRREFVDNNSVFYLSKQIAARREAQRSLINYRKGGQPFMNLLTMIPITGEDDKEIKYYIGLQVDVVEKPTSVEGKDVNGLYAVNYTQIDIPQYQWQRRQVSEPFGNRQLIGAENTSSALATLNHNAASEAEVEMRCRLLLENTDDVVHVLSLKGQFLYLSPSCRKVLEYDASELVGTALSTICHPSDIVPVTRELRDASVGTAISTVFRIRRKESGYIWFEVHGSLNIEQGKTRKWLVLVGRERPIYSLSRRDIEGDWGFGENDIWSKLSTSAMFLFVSTNVQPILERSPDELIGTSLQALMRAESRIHFLRALGKARVGERVAYKHEILNKRGVAMQAETKLFPGYAATGGKPTFLIAQTRLLKSALRPVADISTFQSNLMPMGLMNLYPADEVSAPGSTSSTQERRQSFRPNISAAVARSGSSPEDNFFNELEPTRSTSWQFELRQMEKSNRLLSEELASLLSNRKKRKRRKGAVNPLRDCANCHTRVTPEWRRGPSGQRDLCNSCGLRWAKQMSRGSSDPNGQRVASQGQAQSGSSSTSG